METRYNPQFTTYGEYYHQMLEDSLEYQDFLTRELSKVGIHIQCFSSKKYQWDIGESNNGVEVKFDKMFSKTGNLWIETHEKSNPANCHYAASGINRDGILHWIQGDYGIAFMFSKKELSRFLSLNSHRLQFKENNSHSSMGYLISKFDADLVSITKFRFNDRKLVETTITKPDIANPLLYPPAERPREECNLTAFGVA